MPTKRSRAACSPSRRPCSVPTAKSVAAVAQGLLQVGGFSAGSAAASVVSGVPTAGRIPSGAVVEREIDFKLEDLKTVKLALRNPDLTTARRITDAINAYLGVSSAVPIDSGTVVVAYAGRL